MTRTEATRPIAAADRAAAEAMLRDIAFVLEMTRRAKGIDTTAMHAQAAAKRTRRPANRAASLV